MAKFDVIVIGAGVNGLVCAAYLAKAGRRVVVVERADGAGGLAAGDEFHPGFTTVGPLHDTAGLREDVEVELELARYGLATTHAIPAVFAPQPADAGRGLVVPGDAGSRSELGEADGAQYAAYRAFLDRIRPALQRLLDNVPSPVTGPAASLWTLAGHGLAVRRLGRRDMMELLRIGPMCVADWLNEWFSSEWLSCILAAPALYGTSAGPWSPGTVANLLRQEALASGPRATGGPLAVVEALVAATRGSGADVRFAAEVKAIRTGTGAAVGVTLTGGETIDADVIVSTVDPKQTFLKWLPAGAIAPTPLRRIQKLRTQGTTAKLDLAIRGELRFACRPDLEIETARIVDPHLDDMERAFDAVKYGRVSDRPWLGVYVPTVARPEMAPADHSVVSVVAHFAPSDLRAGWTELAREHLEASVLGRLSEVAPGLADQIVAHRVLTPLDIESRYGVTDGHIHHVEHALDQMIVRPTPECARYATPIPGLYLGGSGCHPGGGVTGGPGRLAARRVLGDG